MRLSISDNRRITDLITDFTNEDWEEIRNEVERLHNLKSQIPIYNAIAAYHPTEFTALVDEYLSLSDVDYQVYVSECFWDLLMFRVTREFAIARYVNSWPQEA
ncbi:hypothetical protein F3J37_01390 [Pantoea sp. Al-1710]|uniref:Uncharacterized protein n=1 Tax=Candidatus Pantoea communis TaxID=2608354 RepID=A0ABX0RI84_9GAMM|nr:MULTISPECIES: hypothetical protein [Pantoea]NIG12968.1 hypothetical protein [Pantoea sp. Cy-640]NIG17331.1 hypothetical protein [Pantoea communis]